MKVALLLRDVCATLSMTLDLSRIVGQHIAFHYKLQQVQCHNGLVMLEQLVIHLKENIQCCSLPVPGRIRTNCLWIKKRLVYHSATATAWRDNSLKKTQKWYFSVTVQKSDILKLQDGPTSNDASHQSDRVSSTWPRGSICSFNLGVPGSYQNHQKGNLLHWNVVPHF